MAFLASGDLLSFSAMLESGHWPSTLEVLKTLQESSLQVGPKGLRIDLGVSKNMGNPQIIHFNRVFHYKPSILGYPYFWKRPFSWG